MKKLIFVFAVLFLTVQVSFPQIVKKFTGHTAYVNTVAFSPGGKYIASGGFDGEIKIWDTENGKIVNEIKTGHTIYKLLFVAEAKQICAGTEPLEGLSTAIDSFVVAYNIYDGNINNKLDVKCKSPNYFITCNGNSLVSLNPELYVDSCKYTYDYSLKKYSEANCYKLLMNKYNLSDNSCDSNIRIDNIDTWSFNSPWILSENGKYLAVCPVKDRSGNLPVSREKANDYKLNSEDYGHYVYFFNADSKILLNKIKIINSYLRNRNILLSNDAKYFYYTAVEYFNDVIKILDVDKDEDVKILSGHNREIMCIAMHPSGKFIASGSKDNTIRIWDVKTGKSIKILEGHTDNVNYVSFSSDGRYLASASDDKTVMVWDLTSISSEIDLYALKYNIDKGLENCINEEKNFELNKNVNLNADKKAIDDKYSKKFNELYNIYSEEYNSKKK